ncbi:MAG TPA: phosphomethylpyrimidine synthase ThiC, partial [Ghiorsea sp.]|nr:phosphomethylpyrimidine synthase ThiC [Ghiorsea sp.]
MSDSLTIDSSSKNSVQMSSGSKEARQPYPSSKKVYIEGSRPDIRVPMREITLLPTQTSDGFEENHPILVYDTSGPYTDPEVELDLQKGLPNVRSAWIEEREDTAPLTGLSSKYGNERRDDTSIDHLRFEHLKQPRKAKVGKNVSQMHYARQGIITPEMEYVAIRENQKREHLREITKQHPGQSFG